MEIKACEFKIAPQHIKYPYQLPTAFTKQTNYLFKNKNTTEKIVY
jgi:hypothetical protein